MTLGKPGAQAGSWAEEGKSSVIAFRWNAISVTMKQWTVYVALHVEFFRHSVQ